jgi:signal transduction histidine kinase
MGTGPSGGSAISPTMILRLLFVVVAALALPSNPTPVVVAVLLGTVAYVVAAGILGLVGPRLLGARIAYLSAVLDVGAVTAFLGLVHPTSLPLWVLYIFPLAAAALAGPGPVLAAAGLGVGGWWATLVPADTVSVSTFWPAAVLAALAAALAVALAGVTTDTREKSGWYRFAAIALAQAQARAEEREALRREAERVRATLEALPAPVALWLPDGSLVLANAAYEALGLGHAPPSPSTERWEEVSLGDPPRTFVAATFPVGSGLGMAALYHEVTREREALRAKDELIALIGHELRNPLTSLHGYTQMMARQLGTVQHQVNRLNQLIGDFMDSARLDGGQLPLRRQLVDLAEIATGAVERFRAAHAGRSLRLELAEVAPVDGDPVRLGQVVDNLLGNAAKYSPPDPEIVLTVRMEGDRVVLSVQDHGAGIAPEHLPHLFDRFYRAPGPETQQVKGLGLGLAIVRDLVAAHGGQAWAESGGPGQGSTFWISLPSGQSAGRGALDVATRN